MNEPKAACGAGEGLQHDFDEMQECRVCHWTKRAIFEIGDAARECRGFGAIPPWPKEQEADATEIAWRDGDSPPVGVWAFSTKDGLFKIVGATGGGYMEVAKVYRKEHRRLETGTLLQAVFHGPFLYPIPDPTS